MARDKAPAVKEEPRDIETSTEEIDPFERTGAYFVVLDRDRPGLYTSRPPDTALGRHVDLLPIVVTCRDKDLAQKIYQLNEQIIEKLDDPNDPKAFRHAIMTSRHVRSHLMHPSEVKFYAFKVTSKTGIYNGFEWASFLRPLTTGKTPEYKKFTMFGNALLWMLDKAHLQPQFIRSGEQGLSSHAAPQGNKQPPLNSRQPPAHDESMLRPSPAVGAHSDVFAARPRTPAKFVPPSPARPVTSRSNSPVKRSNSPVKATSIAAIASMRMPTTPTSPRKLQGNFPLAMPGSPSFRHERGPSPTRARGDRVQNTDDLQLIDVSDEDDAQDLDEPSCLMLTQLRHIIRPAELSASDVVPVLNLGVSLDVWFAVQRLTAEQQLFVLQAFIWSSNVTEFSMTVGRPPLELRVADAEYAWDLLLTWVASL
ncbi:hypothetical protein C2E23DRAFT_885126 [Lenzites betulinus]|nr:hypothetical protein C2E23DRAFT_885126 [Lenzites betulinus]